MARVIFPSGGAFKAAKPQYVQAYRRPQKQQSNWLTDATRAVDLVGKVVDNPLVSYITNEIYNASRDMDPEEIAQKAMQKREEAQQQQMRQAPDSYVNQGPPAPELGPKPQTRDELREEQASLDNRSFSIKAMPQDLREAQEWDRSRREKDWKQRHDSLIRPMPEELKPGVPQAPQDLAEEQVDPVVAGVVDVLSPVMPAEATGAARVTFAKRAINGVGKRMRDSLTKKFRESGKIEDHNLLLMSFNNELIGRAWANLIATGSPHGGIPWKTAYKAAEELHDQLSAQNRRPVELPQMREFRSLSDIAAFAMKNPGLNEEQIKALVRRGGEVAKLTTGIRGLSDARERGEEKTLGVLMKIVGGTKGISTKDRIAQIKQIAESFMEVDKELFKQIRMTPVKEPKKASGAGGAGKRGKGSGGHPDIVVEVGRDKSGKPIKKRVSWQEAHDKGYTTVSGEAVPDPDSAESSEFGLANISALKFRNSRAGKVWLSRAKAGQGVELSRGRLELAITNANNALSFKRSADELNRLTATQSGDEKSLKEEVSRAAESLSDAISARNKNRYSDALNDKAEKAKRKLNDAVARLKALRAKNTEEIKNLPKPKTQKPGETKPPATGAPATGETETSRSDALNQ